MTSLPFVKTLIITVIAVASLFIAGFYYGRKTLVKIAVTLLSLGIIYHVLKYYDCLDKVGKSSAHSKLLSVLVFLVVHYIVFKFVIDKFFRKKSKKAEE